MPSGIKTQVMSGHDNRDEYRFISDIYIVGFVEQEETPPMDKAHHQPHVVCCIQLWWRPGLTGWDFWFLSVSCSGQTWVWGLCFDEKMPTRPHVQVREMIDMTECQKNMRHEQYFKGAWTKVIRWLSDCYFGPLVTKISLTCQFNL